MRERFLKALRRDAHAGRPLASYGNALESAFRQIFGGRGATAATPAFLAWLRGALAEATSPEEREQLGRGREPAGTPRGRTHRRFCARSVTFNSETGHVPADHPEVLYWSSALVPDWQGAHFRQLIRGRATSAIRMGPRRMSSRPGTPARSFARLRGIAVTTSTC